MNSADPPLHNLAEKLLAEERDNSGVSEDPATVRVCGKLGALLSKLAGTAGYCSLLSRALALAQAYAPALKGVHVAPEGTLAGLAEAKAANTKEEVTRGEIAVVVQLLGLLHTFIGEPLTRQLLKEAWPELSMPNADPSKDHTS